jgi:hypothetical protein
MRRISPFSRAGFVAWFFVVESVLGYLHLGEFSVRLIGNLFAWMQSNFFVDLFLGLGMLLLLNQWPNIEPHIPAWMRFKPAHERLRDVESHLRTIQGFIGDQPKPNYPQLCLLVDSKIDEFTRLCKQFNLLMSRADRFESWLLTLSGMIQATPPLTMRSAGAVVLSHQASYAYGMLDAIRELYRQSAVYAAPFSGKWRPSPGAEPGGEAVRMGLAFTEFLRVHLERCAAFCRDWNVDQSTELQTLRIASSSSLEDYSGESCLRMLQKHREAIDSAGKAHAASFADPTLSFAMSRTDQTC